MQLSHVIITAGAGRVKRNIIGWSSHNVKFRIVVFGELWVWIVICRASFRATFLWVDEWLQAETVFGLLNDLGWYCVFMRSWMFDFSLGRISLNFINRPFLG